MSDSKDKLIVCCFWGHRKIKITSELEEKLIKIIEDLITSKGVIIFLFGSKSEFDTLCHKAVTDLKEKYPRIKRVYVRSEYQHINDSYKEYLLESYEDTYYPEKICGAGRASYVERNREMIDKSDYCVVYCDENYLPPKKKNTIRGLIDHQSKSGTRVAYEYAVKKKKEIINILEYLQL